LWVLDGHRSLHCKKALLTYAAEMREAILAAQVVVRCSRIGRRSSLLE
jgi:hypothetical protein